MPITKRLYEKTSGVLNVPSSILPSPSVSPTPSVTPTVTVTPSITPTISVSPSIPASPSVTPTPTPSTAYYYVANIYACSIIGGQLQCGQYLGQGDIYSNTALAIGKYYINNSTSSQIYQAVSETTNPISPVTVNSTSYNSCYEACVISVSPSPTPSVSITPSITPSPSV